MSGRPRGAAATVKVVLGALDKLIVLPLLIGEGMRPTASLGGDTELTLESERILPDATAVGDLLARMEADQVAIPRRWDEPSYVAFKCLDPDGRQVEVYWEPLS
ncbi:MAG TPA: hypothetical protein VFA45_18410 [Actinomycetes bacterium]|nr:hypothetical protein [Actinomycetes bacterium]